MYNSKRTWFCSDGWCGWIRRHQSGINFCCRREERIAVVRVNINKHENNIDSCVIRILIPECLQTILALGPILRLCLHMPLPPLRQGFPFLKPFLPTFIRIVFRSVSLWIQYFLRLQAAAQNFFNEESCQVVASYFATCEVHT